MWYAYFLELSNKDIYVGSTDDLKRRFASHQAGHVLSTKAYRLVVLKSYVAVQTEEHARELEAYFKSGSGKANRLQAPCPAREANLAKRLPRQLIDPALASDRDRQTSAESAASRILWISPESRV